MDSQSQYQPQVPVNTPSSNKLKWLLIGVALLVVVVALVFFFTNSNGGRILGASTSSTYQAVFLTNGQVYFGKLADKGDWIELTDIYYLQVTQNLQNASSADQAKDTNPATSNSTQQSPNIQLVKLGSELHGPQDVMHIMPDKILFWEDMKDDSKVLAAIKQHKSK